MSEKDTPRWKVNKNKYNVKYNREHSTKITVQFYESDERYVRIWRSIPKKVDWLREQLDRYAKENSLD
jgi:hypothetical protein